MSYLAIARKYRPATFDEIVGQEHVTRTLRNAIANDRIHHAYLFSGARGVGKTTAARALARSLNCQQGPTATPCGECTSCTEVSSGASPDLIEIDGASNNSVDDVREIREAVQYAPSRGRRKIYLIDEVHMLSNAAFNALLKTLEEPPPHVVFIFATTEPNKIPDTILSRVQRFDFKRISSTNVSERLARIAKLEGVQISANGLRLIARAGEGSMRDSESLLDQVISYGGTDITDDEIAETLGLIDRSLLHGMLRGLLVGDAAACLAIVDQVYSYGYELSVFTSEMMELLRHATFLRLSDDAKRFVHLSEDELGVLTEMVADVAPDQLSQLFSALLDTHDRVSRASRPRIVLEMAIARLANTRPVQPVGALLDRLEQLERNLRAGGGRGGPPASGGGRSGQRERGSAWSQRSSAPRRAPEPPRQGARANRSTSAGRHGPPEPTEPAPPAGPAEQRPAARQSSRTGPPSSPPRAAKAARPKPKARPKTADPWALPTPAKPRRSEPSDPAWHSFCETLRRGPPRVAVLTKGSPIADGALLRIAMKPGRELAEGQRVVDEAIVAEAIKAGYPAVTELRLEARRDTGKISGAQLEREFLADPSLRRIIETLDARIERITPPPGDLHESV